MSDYQKSLKRAAHKEPTYVFTEDKDGNTTKVSGYKEDRSEEFMNLSENWEHDRQVAEAKNKASYQQRLRSQDKGEIPEPSAAKPRVITLPTDSAERKGYPLMSGVLRYFPAAIAGVARISKLGNDKHNPGQELHHARGKSTDHGDCIVRHLIDVQDLLGARERGLTTYKDTEELLTEVSSLAWRALALSQELHEQFGAPLAPGAKL